MTKFVGVTLLKPADDADPRLLKWGFPTRLGIWIAYTRPNTKPRGTSTSAFLPLDFLRAELFKALERLQRNEGLEPSVKQQVLELLRRELNEGLDNRFCVLTTRDPTTGRRLVAKWGRGI